MTNIVLLIRDRPRLTEQCLRTLYMHTPLDQFNLTIVNDASWPETRQIIRRYEGYSNVQVLDFKQPVGVVGFLRNVGAGAAERTFGRGEWLLFIDNDIAFTPRWLIQLKHAASHYALDVIGGYRHPFHGVKSELKSALLILSIEVTDAVAGYSHLMKWDVWDQHGPYDQNAKGVCQSEDFAFCQKVVAGSGIVRGRVGYITPPVIHNCGLTNSEGKPAVGADQFPIVPGLIYE